MVAPSIVGQFSASLGQLFSALKTLGFDHVIEVAEGAEETTREESKEWLERMEEGEPFMTTSCCPAWVETAEKHLPELKAYISNTASPMHFSGKKARNTYPNAVNVFIGPCIAKRYEAWKDDTVDLVLSIEELGAMFIASRIDVQKMPETELENISANGRGFAVSGGVSNAVMHEAKSDSLKTIQIDGLSKQSIKEIKRFPKACPGNFVEVMSCEGGCIAGPNVICNPKLASRQLAKLLAT
jgi:iron only hydrogenase large subunit-like protein